MNAATQRRLTPVLVGIVLGLGVLLLALLAGVGSGVHWLAPREVAPLPAAHRAALPPSAPLLSYAAVWEHPLFSRDRQPMVSAASGSGVSLGDLELTGIILTPGLRMALLRDKSAGDKSNREVRVREGTALPDGSWTLVELQPRAAIFASSSGRTELKLPAGAPIDPLPAASSTATDQSTPPGVAVMQRVNPSAPAPAGSAGNGPLQRILKQKAGGVRQRAQPSASDEGVH
jgi:general secretion pathway protein N